MGGVSLNVGSQAIGGSKNIDYLNKILYLICDYPHKHYTFKHFEV